MSLLKVVIKMNAMFFKKKKKQKKLKGNLIIESKGEIVIYTQTNESLTKTIRQNSFLLEKRIPKKISKTKLNNLILSYILKYQTKNFMKN